MRVDARIVGILVIFVLIIITCVARGPKHMHYLDGLWVGDPSFMSEAGLSDFQMYVAPPDKAGRRVGYLVMVDGAGGFVSNQAISVTVGRSRRSGVERKADAHIEFSEHPLSIPSDVELRLSVLKGSLVLCDEHKVYAFLWKDHVASSAAAAAWSAPQPA